MRLNSYDDFTPLKEVVLGSADGYLDRVRDMSFDMFISDNLSGARGYYPSISTWRDSEERRDRNTPTVSHRRSTSSANSSRTSKASPHSSPRSA